MLRASHHKIMLFLITQPNFQGKHSKECFIISVVAMAVFFDLVLNY